MIPKTNPLLHNWGRTYEDPCENPKVIYAYAQNIANSLKGFARQYFEEECLPDLKLEAEKEVKEVWDKLLSSQCFNTHHGQIPNPKATRY